MQAKCTFWSHAHKRLFSSFIRKHYRISKWFVYLIGAFRVISGVIRCIACIAYIACIFSWTKIDSLIVRLQLEHRWCSCCISLIRIAARLCRPIATVVVKQNTEWRLPLWRRSTCTCTTRCFKRSTMQRLDSAATSACTCVPLGGSGRGQWQGQGRRCWRISTCTCQCFPSLTNLAVWGAHTSPSYSSKSMARKRKYFTTSTQWREVQIEFFQSMKAVMRMVLMCRRAHQRQRPSPSQCL